MRSSFFAAALLFGSAQGTKVFAPSPALGVVRLTAAAASARSMFASSRAASERPISTVRLKKATRDASVGQSGSSSSNFDRNYLARSALCSCLLRGGSDILSQALGRGELDLTHAAAMGTVGLLFSGIIGAAWLALLESRLGSGTESRDIVRKAAVDYCFFAPLANSIYLLFVPMLCALSEPGTFDMTSSLCHSASMWQANFGSAMQLEAEIFVPFNLVAFRLIPPPLRPQAQACMCCAYTLGLSSLC